MPRSGSDNPPVVILPRILAGPVLRRADEKGVLVWIATEHPAEVWGGVYRAKGTLAAGPNLRPLGEGRATSLRLGQRLFVTLVEIKPSDDTFPTRELLAYNLQIKDTADSVEYTLYSSKYFEGTNRISYEPYSLPTFFLATHGNVNILHGSCRMPHGDGEDALAAADFVIGLNVDDMVRRPSALFLTGDQIYADDVAECLTTGIRVLGFNLLGFEETVLVEGGHTAVWKFGREKKGERGMALADCFTPNDPKDPVKNKARNHLIGFGEFAAMHLLSWSPDVWTGLMEFPDASVESFFDTVPRVRRAMANVPTYMIFDDHEVTDDWNLNKYWEGIARSVRRSRRVIANALAAYWAFQAWGNSPASFPDHFRQPILDYFGGGGKANSDHYENAVMDHKDWAFVAPTHPRAIFIDSRTRRGPDWRPADLKGPPELMGKAAVADFLKLAKETSTEDRLMLVVSPAPVIGWEAWEWVQELASVRKHIGDHVVDLESWHFNKGSFYRFLLSICDHLKPRACLFLSGDVHFGYVAKAELRLEHGAVKRTVKFSQFTSSALKHEHTRKERAELALVKCGPIQEWVWQTPGSDLPRVGNVPVVPPNRRVEPPRSEAEELQETLGPPDCRAYLRAFAAEADFLWERSPYLLWDSNLGQLEIDSSDPGNQATYRFLDPKGKTIQSIKAYLDYSEKLRRGRE